MPLIVGAALSGICAFGFAIIVILSGYSDDLMLWLIGAVCAVSIVLSISAWGVRRRKSWAWIPAVAISCWLATMIPIGTIIAYFALSALWRCRAEFFPFSLGSAGVTPELESE